MTHTHHHFSEKEHNTRLSIGLFFIVLGLALLVATNDLLDLGSISEYFTWKTALVFIGLLLLINRNFTGGIIMIAAGGWFLLDEIFVIVPDYIETIYWPAVIILIGLSFIVASLTKRKQKEIK
ncbi:MAG TPA: DUF5668 domain-containing protein [Bacteroidales bacterium]|nr:DUF5668 domain-containing protein [Bacteroidales bacterium]HPT20903.1 DUF5668 domain-containing protein [Bacteroidales bacterium]